jgi:hypothetical protein
MMEQVESSYYSRLNDQDIAKLKYEKRIGYVFASIVIFAGVLLTFFAIVLSEKVDWNALIIIDVLMLFLSFLIQYFMNRKINLDLRENEKIIKIETVQLLESEPTYEAGSGNLYIPGLGDLFPKLWGQKMRKSIRKSVIFNNTRYDIDPEIFNQLKVGDSIEFHLGKYSETILAILPHIHAK